MPAFLFVKKTEDKNKEDVYMDVRSENETGKLLFKWDPETDVVSISCRDAIYDVKLIRTPDKSTYHIVGKRYKKDMRGYPQKQTG
jgi:hypothetical protein